MLGLVAIAPVFYAVSRAPTSRFAINVVQVKAPKAGTYRFDIGLGG